MTFDASDPAFYFEANRPAYLEIHANHPVYHVQAANSLPFWNACTHDAIREIGNDPDRFSTKDGVHLSWAMFGSEEEASAAAAMKTVNILEAAEHLRVRAPVEAAFRPKTLPDWETLIRGVVRDVLEKIEPGDADFMHVFADRIPMLTMARVLGVSEDRERDIKRWSDALVASFEPGAEPDWDSAMEMIGFLGPELAAHRETEKPGLLGELLRSELSDEEVLMWTVLLLSAGTETTANLIGGGMRELSRNPDQTQKLVADPGLLRPAVSEMLRCVTPGRYIRRTVMEATELCGQPLKAGDAVVMNFTVANADPDRFPDPFRFDVERRPPDSLAFGVGVHRCVGRNLARLEGAVAFEELLARFPNTTATGDAVVKPTLATTWIESLPVRFG